MPSGRDKGKQADKRGSAKIGRDEHCFSVDTVGKDAGWLGKNEEGKYAKQESLSENNDGGCRAGDFINVQR